MDILVPIFIAGIMPISIVLIVFIASMNADNKRAKVLIKAIESNNNVDADKLALAFRKQRKSAREIRNRRLLLGSIFTLVGLVILATGVVEWSMKGSNMEEVISNVMMGGIGIAVGASYLIVYKVSGKQLPPSEDEEA